ncbi:hypothetical protein D0810_19085 [Vibrio cholerae]|uniref:hypothetical protein n=1 Tax=Vibrio cholerae TaxID=666 RepID=UPI000B97840E|nr:hypothetical protein [Vibrio cholerae]EGQ7691913.1 hypothetical protein [Vibrio cholerae]EGQ8395149.1 hypothetical protein [Vibrio cholerae]EGQ9579720.1 hypothetical protein [Vibrio cholerae]EGQ9963473.1 hypothetical protein [Vibrio cholerae]EGQ9985079.1 hypothetical protein [Vibrio cholerae]
MASILISIITTVLTIVAILLFQGEISHLFGVEQSSTTTLSVIKDFLAPISSSFGGALLGAIGAYKLALRKDHKDTKEDELALLTSAFFVLKSQLSDLVAIKKSNIVPYQTKPARMIDIPISVSVISVEQRVPEKAFSVLIKYKKPSVAEAIYLAERRYLNQKTIHSKRNDLIKSYYDHIERGGVVIFEKLNLHKSCEKFGINNMCQLYSMTESFITFTDDAIYSLLAAMKDLQDAIDSEFSSKAYVKVKLEIPTKNQQYFEPVVSPTIKSVEQLYEMLKKVSFEQKMYHPASYKII